MGQSTRLNRKQGRQPGTFDLGSNSMTTLHCQFFYSVSSGQRLRRFWLSLWRSLGVCCQTPTDSLQGCQWLSCLWRQWVCGYQKAGFGSLIVYPEFPPGALLLSFPEGRHQSRYDGLEVAKFKSKSHLKTQTICIPCCLLPVGKLEQIKKRNLTWDMWLGGKKKKKIIKNAMK